MREWYARLSADAADRTGRGRMSDADWEIAASNPYCGDDITIYVRLDGERVDRICYEGEACQVCCASAAILAREMRGQPLATLASAYRALADGLSSEPAGELPQSLVVFEAIRAYPVRRKCALLPWQAVYAHMKSLEN